MAWAAGLGALATGIGALIKGGVDTPEIKPVQLADPSTGFTDFMKQADWVNGLNGFLGQVNDTDNKAFRDRLGQVDPNLVGNVGKAGENIKDYLSGKLPEDVTANVLRTSAERGVLGGTSGSQFARNITARDLGLTSLSLMDRGFGMLGNQMQLARALTPANATVGSMLMTPQQFLARRDQQAFANTQAYNQNQALQYQASVSQAGNWSQFLNALAGFGGMQMSQGYFNPAPSGGTGYGG